MGKNTWRLNTSAFGGLAAVGCLLLAASCTVGDKSAEVVPLICVGYGGGEKAEQICSEAVTKGNRCAWHIDVMIAGGAAGDTVTGTCGNTTATCTVAAGRTGCKAGKRLGRKTSPFTCSSNTRGSYGCGATDP